MKTHSIAKEPEDTVYRLYYEFSFPVSKTQGHQVLAIDRGEREKILKVSVDMDRDAALVVDYLVSAGVHGNREVQRALQVQQRGQGTYLHNMPREMLRQCFPSAEVLHKRYPRPEKAPWLLPAYWAVRAVRIVAQERYKIGQARRSSSKKAYDQLREVYLAAGVLEK